MIITALQSDDYEQWLPLWQANCLNQVSDDVTSETWNRLNDPFVPVHGFSVRLNGRIAGILHYILHPTTGQIAPVCYMQDLFIDPAHRRKGLARSLVEHLYEEGKRQAWARIYWLAEGKNEAAQNLYKTLGVKVDFTLHILPTGT